MEDLYSAQNILCETFCRYLTHKLFLFIPLKGLLTLSGDIDYVELALSWLHESIFIFISI